MKSVNIMSNEETKRKLQMLKKLWQITDIQMMEVVVDYFIKSHKKEIEDKMKKIFADIL